MAQIVKREGCRGVTYRVRVRLRGGVEESASFRRLTDAKRWAQKVEAAVYEGRHVSRSAARRKLLRELLERYEAEVLAHRPITGGKLASQLRRWRDELGHLYLIDVTPARIAEVRDKLARESTARGGKRAPATVNRYLAALSHAFSVAVREWGWVADNPVRRVQSLKEPRGRVRFLDEDERVALLEACKDCRDRRLYALVVLALSTGARQGELLKLRWKDVDFDRGRAVLHETRNGERRAIPILGPAREVLADLGQVRNLHNDLVFANRSGKAHFPRKAWLGALETAGLDDFRFHDLRHTAASYLAMSGATLAEMAEILGHKTLAMVKRYAHLTETHKADVVARMNRRFLVHHGRSSS